VSTGVFRRQDIVMQTSSPVEQKKLFKKKTLSICMHYVVTCVLQLTPSAIWAGWENIKIVGHAKRYANPFDCLM
jgi:hypothetical protein